MKRHSAVLLTLLLLCAYQDIYAQWKVMAPELMKELHRPLIDKTNSMGGAIIFKDGIIWVGEFF